MRNWKKEFGELPEEELDKVAMLRLIECTNGVIQYAHRDEEEWALPIEETREAMQYSMGSIKRMQIDLRERSITFEEPTETLFKAIRDLYIEGVKMGNDEAFEKFLHASKTNLLVCGKERLQKMMSVVREEVPGVIGERVDWGMNYIWSFCGWNMAELHGGEIDYRTGESYAETSKPDIGFGR